MARVSDADEAVCAEIVDVAVGSGDAHVGVRGCFVVDVVDGETAGKGRWDCGEGSGGGGSVFGSSRVVGVGGFFGVVVGVVVVGGILLSAIRQAQGR